MSFVFPLTRESVALLSFAPSLFPLLHSVSYLESNSALHEAVVELSLPTVEQFTVPQSGDDPSLNGQLMLPPDFRETRQYPVLVYVYGGPYSQQVS